MCSLQFTSKSFSGAVAINCLCPVDAITVEAWTTMPKSASCLPSPRGATSARALSTWSPAAQSKHSSPHRLLRENRPRWKRTKGSTASRHHLPSPRSKREIGSHWSTEANQTASLAEGGKIHNPPPQLLKPLLELPQVEKKTWRMFFFLN